MKQRFRNLILLISLLLLPATLNYLSPYVSIDGAMNGIISGSLLLFILLFIFSIFLGRAWCGWLCPMGGLAEFTLKINSKNVNIKKLRIIRYVIFSIWFSVIIIMFVFAGGIKGINPLHLTENVISVDAPMRYVIYYSVLILFLVSNILIGKRGACHSFCWISPFLTAGYNVGKMLKIPQLRVVAVPEACVNCGSCNKKCSMSIPVSSSIKDGLIKTSDCILCGECIDTCNRKALSFGVKLSSEKKI
jgi:ferredoxin-type protein NapH